MNRSSSNLNLINKQTSDLEQKETRLKSDPVKGEIGLMIGNRVPRRFFWTSGSGESDITIHAGSYHLALKEAGIEKHNIMVYSSILPSIAEETSRPKDSEITYGSVMESIMAVSSGEKGKRLTAGIIYGWLYDKLTGKKYGGLVAEYSGHEEKEDAEDTLRGSLNELYTNGFSEKYDMKDIKMQSRSFVPRKKFGTAIVALGFKDYLFPLVR